MDYLKFCKSSKYTPAIHEKVDRIIVMGDIHGDLTLAVNLLEISKIARFTDDIDMIMRYDPFFIWNEETVRWIGGDSYIVQVGDQIDRCRPIMGKTCNDSTLTENDEMSDILIMNLFNELDRQSRMNGNNGRVISLFGNHEIMNATGYMDYVSYKGIEQFRDYKDPIKNDMKFPFPMDARKHAFKPGNEYGKMMGCTRLPAVIIGSNLFVHAGIVDGLLNEIGIKYDKLDKKKNAKPIDARNKLEEINRQIKQWLLGSIDEKNIEYIIQRSSESMFWTRLLGNIPPGVDLSHPDCTDNIEGVLEVFDINNIIIGHTPQSFMYSHNINSTCSGKVWRVDQGSSKAFDGFDPNYIKKGKVNDNRRTQYLEILNDTSHKVCDIDGCIDG